MCGTSDSTVPYAFLLLIFSLFRGEREEVKSIVMFEESEFASREDYIEYLKNHPNLDCCEDWKDCQLSNGRLSTYKAYFYILRYDQTYVGVLESERPYSATYLYRLPNKYCYLYSYIYSNDLADPYIPREPNDCYIKQIERVNQLLDWKKNIERINQLVEKRNGLDDDSLEQPVCTNSGVIECDNNNLYIIEEELDEIMEKIVLPIKYRGYFIEEIAHTNVKEWRFKLENIMSEYLTKGYEKKSKQYDIPFDKGIDPLIFAFRHSDVFWKVESIVAQIKEDIERENMGEVIKEPKLKSKPKPKPKPKPKLKPITNYGYELKDLNNKSLKEIASLYFISPNELLGMIQRRIPSARIADVDSKLDLIQISICRRIFEELYYVNKDKIDR